MNFTTQFLSWFNRTVLYTSLQLIIKIDIQENWTKIKEIPIYNRAAAEVICPVLFSVYILLRFNVYFEGKKCNFPKICIFAQTWSKCAFSYETTHFAWNQWWVKSLRRLYFTIFCWFNQSLVIDKLKKIILILQIQLICNEEVLTYKSSSPDYGK